MVVRRIEPEEAKTLLESDQGYVYLDVRTAEEFGQGHVPGAVNIPLLHRGPAGMQPNPAFLEETEKRFEKEERLIVGCMRGGRSLKAAEILVASGFSQVVDMRGGYDGEMDQAGNITYPGWARRGLPTTTEG